jgi:hypothetical protein
VAGYSVLGDSSDLVEMVSRGDADCVVVNTHLSDADKMNRVEAACAEHDVELLRLHVNLKRLSAAS